MLKRIITAIVALLIFAPIVMWGGTLLTTSVFALIAAVSVYEMLSCCNLNKNIFILVPSVLGAAACVFVPPLFGLRIFAAAAGILTIVICALLYFLGVSVFCHKTIDVETLFTGFGLTVYITAGLTSLSALYTMYGPWAVAFVFCVACFTDTFAYFSGTFFGKKKLCSEISPKKTIAGAIGGTIFGTIAGVVVFILNDLDIAFAICALPLSVISQLGDLSASIVKRRFGVKDYGKIFPGHGGVLDRFDSIIPVSIVTTMIFLGYWIFVWVM